MDDIVFVSINHRLGPIGFSDLSVAGKGFEASGNVGILDLVARLEMGTQQYRAIWRRPRQCHYHWPIGRWFQSVYSGGHARNARAYPQGHSFERKLY